MAELKKSLGYGTIIALSITSMVGTGMFLGPVIATRWAGNMSLISWVLLSFISIYVAFCFGELVSMFPNAGGVYEFAKRSYGRFPSFMIGWITWLVGNITTGVLIVAAINYIIPPGYVLSFLPNLSTDLIKILFAIILILFLNYIGYRGVDASAKLLIFFAIVIIGVLLMIIIPGLFNINMVHFESFFFPGNPLNNGILIFVSLFFILEAYFGWESATFLAEETKNASKIIPIALVTTTILVAILGTLFAFTFLGNIFWKDLSLYSDDNVSSSLKDLTLIFYPVSAWLPIKIGIFIALLGSAAGGIISTPRLLLALARDKLFINGFAEIHEKHQTPYKAIMFQTLITIIIVIIGFGEYKTLLSMLVPLALFMYISVLIAVTIQRYKLPHTKRIFKTPFGKAGPIFISGLYISIIFSWLITEVNALNLFKLVLSFIFFGFPIYLLLLFYYDPDVIIKFNNFFAYFSLAFERILIPKKIDHAIFSHLGNIKGKTILEFGCGVGTLTKELAEKVTHEGEIYATDASYTSVKIANKRIAKRGHINVHFIHDIHQMNRVHHSIPYVDSIVSIGMLGYLQDIKKVLREMHKVLPENGTLFFIDYIDLFKVIPNVSWLSDQDVLIELFRECGFSVKTEKIKGTFWNYIFVYGIKTEHDVPFI
jgi:basic amino acid/polyamine antiporter, APA family